MVVFKKCELGTNIITGVQTEVAYGSVQDLKVLGKVLSRNAHYLPINAMSASSSRASDTEATTTQRSAT